MKEKSTFDFWYAVNNTEIVLMPSHHLETFGTTMLSYHLITELMDTVNQTRVREGRLQANRPQIITPSAYSKTVLEGFGEEARNYIDWLKEHEKDIHILQYGYTLKKEVFTESIISENIKVVTERVQNQVKERNDPFGAVLVGVDDPWDVCLIKLFWEVIQFSAGTNIREMKRQRMFEEESGIPRGVRKEIDEAFLATSRDPALIKHLGKKLQDYGLFEQYQDRFFALVKASKQ
ncbi:MAG: hypothetical protein A2283_17535 [Lentisphaerae bacterium RIFOXYA12_FULL_48_11]|nr:MAG: hypothetical protein A2283_17535 [Lentisphaerae bacterium RIFOXYA12_FULL_48_11]